MNTASACLRFHEGALILETPWNSSARGIILVNGELVHGEWTRAGTHYACAHEDWQITLIPGPTGAFTLEITNSAPEPRLLHTVQFARWEADAFTTPLRAREHRELIHGGSLNNIDAGVKCVGRKTPRLGFIVPSSIFTVYQRETGGALLLGALPPAGASFSECVTVHAEPHFEGNFGFEIRHVFECEVPPAGGVRTAPVTALRGSQGAELMEAYGRQWRDLLQRKPSRAPFVGWNSWDYYSGAVTRQAMDENLDAARSLFGSALQAFVIDEGWERQWGSWEANAKFESGLADFCRHVKEQGGTPGIWTAPLLVNTYNPLFLEHPGWFAARADGQVQIDSYSYGPMAYLDPTQPEVLAHLRDVFTNLRACGFEYFKVDFGQCILNATCFKDRRVGRASLLRRVFAAIREAIGEEAYLLCCGSPYESVAGIVDAARISGDIHIFWGHVLQNAGGFCARWWMHGNLWNNDPDFLVVRGPDTADPPFGKRRVVIPAGPEGGWMAGAELDEQEARAYALLVHLTGGDVILGDALRKLKPNGVDILRRVLQPREQAAAPADLFTSEQDLPRVWISRGTADIVVGLFNWSDKPAHLTFDPAAYGLTGTPLDFWSDAPLSALPERQPGRSAIGLRFPAAS